MDVDKPSNSDLAEDEFVVARISGMKKENDTKYYLIEWEGYDLVDNTWEEEDNIYSSQTIEKFLVNYKRQANLKKSMPLPTEKKILLYNTYDPDTKTYFRPKQRQSKRQLSNSNSSANLDNQKKKTTHKRTRVSIGTETDSVLTEKIDKGPTFEKIDAFEEFTNIIKKSVKVKYPIIRMNNQKNISLYQFNHLKSKVTILNEIDSELPSDFIYIDDLKYTDPVQPPDPDFLSGCACFRTSDCSQGCHDVCAYDENGRLLIEQGTAIYECNKSCECGLKCKNRVVQEGRKIPLQVFKTESKGWGVRSPNFISKGTYIEQYIGEVITVEEGDARGAFYDKLGCSYLFDMDFAQSEFPTKYVIDSYVLGNVSRFFNHSCSPNLEVFAVFYDSADNQMHRLAFFAKKDIQINEELCFDYNGRRDVSSDDSVDGVSRYLCRCDAVACRKWIYL